ncbi:MAG: L-seryl-tRNA(Sec) selenium transferase [Firmicutes bacterium]|nr:L-seryl-tRNA(Sec) selenium transferase [Bacillota bacterium]
MVNKKSILSKIPSVDDLIKNEEIIRLIDLCPRPVLVQVIRDYLDEYRKEILLRVSERQDEIINLKEILDGIQAKVYKKIAYSLKHVVNATGIVIHTNLGRAPLCKEALDLLVKTSSSYSNLEMDIEKGIRGSRHDLVEDILVELTKAEAAAVVNNNAAAVMLVLSTMAKGKEVIVSRGQLIEIGGSFRIPDVMRQSGAKLVEVGTTNKTHIGDYENAINEETALLMKVHTSNYKIMGFTKEISSKELVSLGEKRDIPVIEDIGSGVFIDLSKYGLPYEPTVQNSIASGMDIVTFSGDKMLGGSQAGIIVGNKEYIENIKKNPLARALRVDKMTLAALEATLRLYLDENKAIRSIPVLNMLTASIEEITKKAEDFYNRIPGYLKNLFIMTIEDEFSEVGGGAMPLHKLPTKVITIKSENNSANSLEAAFRNYESPIVTRIYKDKVLIDMRTVMETEYNIIIDALKTIDERL